MSWQQFEAILEKLWRALAGVQLLLAIVVFLVYGWHEKRISADVQKQDIDLRKAEIETLRVAFNTLRKSDSYLIGGEILKIVFSPDRECLTEDQYLVIDFLTDLYNRNTEAPAPREMFLEVMKRRPGCVQKIPDPASTATDGFVVLGAPRFSCADCSSRHFVEFTNFTVLSSLDGAAKLPKPAVVRAKLDIFLRTNTNDIRSGTNPPLRTLKAGQCVEVKDYVEQRGNTWGAVTLRDCP
jgi:hypothetical protein